jgi:hypothetical protein
MSLIAVAAKGKAVYYRDCMRSSDSSAWTKEAANLGFCYTVRINNGVTLWATEVGLQHWDRGRPSRQGTGS